MLTPEAFFLALTRARHVQGQTVDPEIYSTYFQFLQKVVKNYSDYQLAVANIRITALAAEKNMLTDDNKGLLEKVDGLITDRDRPMLAAIAKMLRACPVFCEWSYVIQ